MPQRDGTGPPAHGAGRGSRRGRGRRTTGGPASTLGRILGSGDGVQGGGGRARPLSKWELALSLLSGAVSLYLRWRRENENSKPQDEGEGR